jgi:hypothetical protein
MIIEGQNLHAELDIFFRKILHLIGLMKGCLSDEACVLLWKCSFMQVELTYIESVLLGTNAGKSNFGA